MPTQHPFINKRNIYSVKCTCMNRDYILSSNNTCMYIFSSCKNLTNLLKWYKNTNNKNKLIKLNKITTKSIHVQLQHVILNGRNMKKALDKFTVLQFCQSYVPWHSSSLNGIILTRGIQTSSTLEQSSCDNGSFWSLFYSTDEHPWHCLLTDPVSPVA